MSDIFQISNFYTCSFTTLSPARMHSTPFERSIFLKYSTSYLTGAVEPSAQGYAFAHPIFQAQPWKGHILRTQILTSIK